MMRPIALVKCLLAAGICAGLLLITCAWRALFKKDTPDSSEPSDPEESVSSDWTSSSTPSSSNGASECEIDLSQPQLECSLRASPRFLTTLPTTYRMRMATIREEDWDDASSSSSPSSDIN